MLYNIGLYMSFMADFFNQHKLFRMFTFCSIYFHLFLWPNNSIIWIYYISIIHLSVDRYWGCFYFLAYEHCCSEHSCIHFVWTYVSVSLGYILKVKLPDHVIFLCLMSWRPARLFHSGCTILHSHWQCVWVPISAHLIPTFIICFLIIAIPVCLWSGLTYFWLLELLICNRDHLNSSILI